MTKPRPAVRVADPKPHSLPSMRKASAEAHDCLTAPGAAGTARRFKEARVRPPSDRGLEEEEA